MAEIDSGGETGNTDAAGKSQVGEDIVRKKIPVYFENKVSNRRGSVFYLDGRRHRDGIIAKSSGLNRRDRQF